MQQHAKPHLTDRLPQIRKRVGPRLVRMPRFLLTRQSQVIPQLRAGCNGPELSRSNTEGAHDSVHLEAQEQPSREPGCSNHSYSGCHSVGVNLCTEALHKRRRNTIPGTHPVQTERS